MYLDTNYCSHQYKTFPSRYRHQIISTAAETEAVGRICVTNPPERKIFDLIVFTDKIQRRKSGSWFRNGFVRMECSRTHVPST